MADEPDDGAVYVGSGSFRVDRQRALEVLSRYQVPEPWMYLLPLLRCAAASGARAVFVSPSPGAVEVAFDGKPFTRAELADPYAGLFEEEVDVERRRRELALGLLAALRLAPARVSVSAPGMRLQAEGLEGERLVEDPVAAPGDTVVKVESRSADLWKPDYFQRLERWCRTSAIPVQVGGLELRRGAPEGAPGREFDEDGVRGWITIPEKALDACSLDACCLGVYVAKIRPSLPRVQVDGQFDSDALRLDASQSGIVEDEAYARAVKVLEGQAARLFEDAAGRQRALLAEAGETLRDPAALAHWRGLFEERPEQGPGAFVARLLTVWRPREELYERLDWCARTTAWLRSSAMRLKAPVPPSADPLSVALWNVPLLLRTDGTPLSLAEVFAMREKLEHLPVSRRPTGSRNAVWLTTSRDVEVLSRHLPESLQMAEVMAELESPDL